MAQIINEDGLLHFVVVKQIEKDQIVVFDPSKNKKQTETLNNFLSVFNGNVLLFKPNLKMFKLNYNFKLTKMKSIINFSFFCFILLNLVSTLLFIIDTQFLKMFFNSLANEKQEVLLYLFPIIILILSMLCKTLANSILRQSYKRRRANLLSNFLSLVERQSNLDFFSLYQEIIWVSKFENYILIASIANLVAEIVSLIFIYFILKQIFLVILIADLIYIFINFILNSLIKYNFENRDKEWFFFLNTINQIKNEGTELKNYKNMLNLAEEQKGYDFNSNVIEIWDKLSLIIIYAISW